MKKFFRVCLFYNLFHKVESQLKCMYNSKMHLKKTPKPKGFNTAARISLKQGKVRLDGMITRKTGTSTYITTLLAFLSLEQLPETYQNS